MPDYLVTIIVSVISLGGGYFASRHLQGSREDRFIARLQEQIDSLRKDVEDLKNEGRASGRRERIIHDYAVQLRWDCTQHGVSPDSLRPWPDLADEGITIAGA